MKKILSLLFCGFVALTAAADTARPTTFVAQQADGTQLTLRMVGDEHFHYFVDVNSGATMLRDADGNYFAATEAQLTQYKTAAGVHRQAANARRIERLPMRPDAAPGERNKVLGNFKELVGTRRGLVILVNFASSERNLPFEMQTTRDQWEAAFNQVGYNENNHVGSVHDYFYDQSYGQFDLEFDVVGPVTVSRSLEYYGQNNSYGSDARPASMVVEACKLVDKEVDFSQYDWDNDGEVEQVYVIYAGYGEATGGADPYTIWPHEYTLQNSNYHDRLKVDYVYVNTYACSNELCGTEGVTMTGIGTACHEFSHCIGYPDFYDVDYSGAFAMDAFDIMCNGGHSGPSYNCEVPCGYTAYERWMGGWLEPKVLDKPCIVSDMKNIGDSPEAYVIYNAGHKDEYFLLENRVPTRWFSYLETFPAGHGMLVTHVDYSANSWQYNQVNDNPAHQRMTIIPAGGSYGTYLESYKSWKVTQADFMSMFFPGSKHVTALTNDSHTDSGAKLWNKNTDGTRFMNKAITDIEECTSEGTISFVFMGDVESGNRWTVSLDAGCGTTAQPMWTQSADNEKIVLPAAEAADERYKFLGWSAEYVQPTSTRPARLLNAGTAYRPVADVTLYAVYGYSEAGPVQDEYRLVNTLTDGRNYVFATKGAATTAEVFCLSTAGLLPDTYVKSPTPLPISVDFDQPVPTISNPGLESVWRVAVSDDEIVLRNGIYSLALSNTDGFALSTTPYYAGWNDKNGLYTVKDGSNTKYYMRLVSGQFSFNKTGSSSARMFAYEESDLSDLPIIYTTGADVSGLPAITLPATSHGIYNLAGQRTNTYLKGINIEAGKKVVR